VRCLEECDHWRRDHLPPDDLSRLNSQHGLAMAYQSNGQIKEAVSLLEAVVKFSEQTQGEDHPDRLTSQHVLATMFWDLGQHATALQLMEHVVEVRKKVLDEDHPDRRNSEVWLEYFQDETTGSE
jgi:hypothetical protein